MPLNIDNTFGLSGIIHLSGVVCFLCYFLYACIGNLKFLYNRFSSISRFVLSFSLLVNLFMLLLMFSTDLIFEKNNYFFQSHPALILILVSFILYVLIFIKAEVSSFFSRIFALASLFIYFLGAMLLHNTEASRVYAISPELLIHIILSLVSQVLLVVVFVLSISIVVIDKSIRTNNSLSKLIQKERERLPAIIPTQNLWEKITKLAMLFFVLSIVTGLIQTDGLKYFEKIFFSIMQLLGILFAYLVFKFSKLSTYLITFFLTIYILIAFVLQIISRGELFKF